MRTKSFSITLFVVAFIALSANIGQMVVWALAIFHDPEHPGKCVINGEIILSPGDTLKLPDQCLEMTCVAADGAVSERGCSLLPLPDGCEWGDFIDVQAPFQKCCARELICASGMTNATLEYEQEILELLGW